MWDLPFLSNIWTPAPWRNVMPWQVVMVMRVMSRYIYRKEEPPNNDREKGGRGLERIGFVVRPDEATASSVHRSTQLRRSGQFVPSIFKWRL